MKNTCKYVISDIIYEIVFCIVFNMNVLTSFTSYSVNLATVLDKILLLSK